MHVHLFPKLRLKPSPPEAYLRAEPGVQSSNLPEEDLNKTEAINDHSSKDIKTVEFKDGCTAQVNNTVLASLVQARNHQETPAGTTLEDRHVSEQEAKEYSSKPTQKRVKHVQIHDKRTSEQWVNTNMASIKAPCGIMEQEVVHTETDCTIEDTRPHLLNSERNCRSEPRKKLKRGGDSDVLHNVEVAFPMPSSIPSPRIPDINKMSLDQLKALAIQHNKYGVSIMRKEDLQQLLRSKLRAEVALPMSFNTPSPRIPDINEMSLVQLKELANQHNIYGVSIMQKTDLQQLLRSKLQAEVALPMSSSTPSPRIPDINKMSLVQLKASENQHNIYGVSNMRKEDLQQLLRSKLQAEVAFPMSSSTSSLHIPDINKMSLVQLRALANRHNIYGVSVMRKADLQQLLRSKLSAKHWS
ncbi:hypothetical protein RND71_004254 [Anisodus tanguticus]|uniref:Rho termination factor-like N-terminal domain-containing protein n=1 Tax=Anisodus tanguticus TaxID=243964 RepID=A0AAE1SYB8_9SOLA|nr:hypothetical protein RND71_004254 [Anisodus tanguticus]